MSGSTSMSVLIRPVAASCTSLLRQGKSRYRNGYGHKRSRIPDAVSIELGLAVADEFSRWGDWKIVQSQCLAYDACFDDGKIVCQLQTCRAQKFFHRMLTFKQLNETLYPD